MSISSEEAFFIVPPTAGEGFRLWVGAEDA